MTTSVAQLTHGKWIRSNNGLIAGVCEGLGHRFGIDPWFVRVGWVISLLAFGSGLVLYIILALCLPREDTIYSAYQSKLLGVCRRVSVHSGIDVGLIRTLAVLSALASFGLTALVYFGFYVYFSTQE